jgi:hypothetical protein
MVSDFFANATLNISRNGRHYAVQVGELVFDNFAQGGVPYQQYFSSLHAEYGWDVARAAF